MTKVIFIRHGQTEWNVTGRYQGQSDVKLTEEGRKQAEKLADNFPVAKVDAIYASDLCRAMVTAETIAAKFGLKGQAEPAPALLPKQQGAYQHAAKKQQHKASHHHCRQAAHRVQMSGRSLESRDHLAC